LNTPVMLKLTTRFHKIIHRQWQGSTIESSQTVDEKMEILKLLCLSLWWEPLTWASNFYSSQSHKSKHLRLAEEGLHHLKWF